MDRKLRKKNKNKKYTVLCVLVIIIIGTCINLLSSIRESRFNVQQSKITIGKVSLAVFKDYLPLRGRLAPNKTVYLDAIEGGRVDQVFVEEGARVAVGDKLLQLSNTKLQLDVISREAQISEQLNNLHNTQLAIDQDRINLKRELLETDYKIGELERQKRQLKKLLKKNMVAMDSFQKVSKEYDYLKAHRDLIVVQQRQDQLRRETQMVQLNDSVNQLNKNLLMARKNLDNLVITAPVDGLLTSLNAELGESKVRGVRMGQIDVIDTFKIVASIDEFYVGRVRLGQMADVVIMGNVHQLQLKKIYSQVVQRQFNVEFEFVENAPPNLRRGQTLPLNLHLGESTPALLIDNGGFYSDTGGNWIFVVSSNGKKAIKRFIKTGRHNTQSIEVLSGLNAGEKVITSSYNNYSNIDTLNIN